MASKVQNRRFLVTRAHINIHVHTDGTKRFKGAQTYSIINETTPSVTVARLFLLAKSSFKRASSPTTI